MTDQPQRPGDAGSVPAPGAAAPPPQAPPAAWGAPPAPVPGAPANAAPGTWGTPAPAPRPSGPRASSWRATLGVLAIILAVLFGANLVNAALPLPEDPGTVDPGPGVPAQPQESTAPVPTEDPGTPAQPGETAIPMATLPPLETAPPQDPGPVDPGAGVDVGAGFVMYPPEGWTIVGSENGLTVFQKSGVLIIIGGVPWPGTASELAIAYRDAWFAGGQFTGDDPQTGEIGNGIPAAALNYTGVTNGTQVDGAIITGSINGSGLLFNVFGASGSLNGVSSDIDQILGTLQYTGG